MTGPFLSRSQMLRFTAPVALMLLVAAAVQGQDAEFFDEPCPDCGPGTLFLWSGSAEFGGPPGMDEPLASDRPDFTEASTTVGRGVWQLEMGYTYLHDDSGPLSVSMHSLPETLLRVGVLADWLELRLGWNYGWATAEFGPFSRTVSGSEDLYLGAKLALTPQDGLLPEMAIVPQMTVPTGSSAFSAGQVLPGLNWLYGWEIDEFFSTGGSTQVNLAVEGSDDEYLEFAQSWTVGYGLTERLSAFTEWFVIAPAGSRFNSTEHYLDGGITYRLSNDLQLDARIGKGISGAAADYFVGTGLVVRW